MSIATWSTTIMPFESFSTIAGYLSILCWLGAQLPQFIKNYKLKSVEGLALPFLANWFIGDTANLLGCILTHQLPFQTVLATYFVLVDAGILMQFAYYSPGTLQYGKKQGTGEETPLMSGSAAPQMGRAESYTSTISTIARSHPSLYRAMERSASNIVAATEEMSERDRERGDDFDQDDDGGMMASWISERSTRTTASGSGRRGRKHVSFRREDLDGEGEDGERTPTHSLSRGRSVMQETGRRDASLSLSRSRTRAGTTGSGTGAGTASMVFLGVWALVGLGWHSSSFPSSSASSSASASSSGYVLPHSAPRIPHLNEHVIPHAPPPSPTEAMTLIFDMPIETTIPPPPIDHQPPTHPSASESTTTSSTASPLPSQEGTTDGPLTPQPPKDGVSTQRLVGRISAWLCTTFYVTSRMPQIWKNEVMRGNIPFLFLFALLGNFFYVLSISFSPEASGEGAKAFILESLPYLLGSGGVLTFDLTILCQLWLYQGLKPRRPRAISRSYSHGSVAAIRERERLLETGLTGEELDRVPVSAGR